MTPEREAEIRILWPTRQSPTETQRDVADLLDALDAAERDLAAIIGAAYPDQPDATATVAEVCEQIGALHDAADSYAASLATVTAERDEALGWKPLAMSEGKRADATRAMLDVIEARLSTERDTAEAALVALREVVESNVPVLNNWKMEDDEKDAAAASIFDALAATPADLAARVRARHRAEALREAETTVQEMKHTAANGMLAGGDESDESTERWCRARIFALQQAEDRLRALAAEAERAK